MLQPRLRIVRRTGLVAWVIVSLSLGVMAFADVPRSFDEIVGAAIVSAATVAGITVAVVEQALVRKAGREFALASLIAPLDEARGLYVELAASSQRWTRSLPARVALSNLLLREERFAEARDLLSAIPMRSLPQPTWWLHLDNRAIATAKAGDPLLAIALAKQALACAPSDAPPEDVAVTKATRGVAYVLAGRFDEAIRVLEEALSQAPPGDHRASCAFYLGEALTALGRFDEAATAYRRAVAEACDSSGGRRAQAKLEQAFPYRV